ncbi:MAG: aldehyde-activating protein [Pseudomonadota bacterium]
MTTNCLCGAVSVTIVTKPDFIHDCNCSLCRKAGAAWGYFPSNSVTIAGNTTSFVRRDKKAPIVEIHSCRHCAATTHFVMTKSFKEQYKSVDQVGINMKLFDPDGLEDVEVRFPNGKDWNGEGPFGYRRTTMTISDSLPW